MNRNEAHGLACRNADKEGNCMFDTEQVEYEEDNMGAHFGDERRSDVPAYCSLRDSYPPIRLVYCLMGVNHEAQCP